MLICFAIGSGGLRPPATLYQPSGLNVLDCQTVFWAKAAHSPLDYGAMVMVTTLLVSVPLAALTVNARLPVGIVCALCFAFNATTT